jgi:hypothetical protein
VRPWVIGLFDCFAGSAERRQAKSKLFFESMERGRRCEARNDSFAAMRLERKLRAHPPPLSFSR